MFKQGDTIQFRKCGGWYNDVGEWRNGIFERESLRCYFINDATGKVNEYWKHRIEIRNTVSINAKELEVIGCKQQQQL